MMPVARPDWGPRTDGPRDTAGGNSTIPVFPVTGKPPEPAAPPRTAAPQMQQLTVDDLALLTPSPAAGEDEVLADARRALASGHLDAASVQKMFGLTDGELETIQRQPVKRASVAAELDAIARRRKADKDGYFKDEAAQARERELLAQRDKLLADQRADEAEFDAANIDPELAAEWEKTGGVELNAKRARDAAASVIDALPDDERGVFLADFDELPAAAQRAVLGNIAIDGNGAARTATPRQLAEFTALEAGELAAAAWGSDAARNVGRVRQRVGAILGSMPAADAAKAAAWFDDLPPEQAAAVLKMLAR